MQEIVKCLNKWREGQNSGPVRAIVEPTDLCNLRCRFCGLHNRLEKDKKFCNELSDQRLLELADELVAVGLKYCEFSGGGEPLCRADVLLQMLQILKNAGVICQITTNGTLFDLTLIKKIVEINVDFVKFSIDSAISSEHDFLRGKTGVFDQLKKSLQIFKEIKFKKNSLLPHLQFATVLNIYNYKNLIELVKLASEFNIEEIYFVPMNIATEYAYEISLKPEHLPVLSSSALEAKNLANRFKIRTNLNDFINSGLVASPDKMKDQVLARWSIDNQGDFFDLPCFEPWYHLVIRANGKVGHCCRSIAADEDDLHFKSLKDIWFGENFNKMRERLKKGDLPEFCQTCISSEVIRNGNIRAFAYKKLNQFQRAINIFRGLIELNPAQSWLWKELGECYIQVGETQRGIEAISKSIDLDPMQEWAWFSLGDAFEKLGEKKKAFNCYSKALYLSPNNFEFKRRMDLIGKQNA